RRLVADGAADGKDMPVTVNAVTPGVVNSSLGRHAPGALQILSAPFKYLLMRTPEKGAETVVFAATDASLHNVSGKYWGDCKQIESSPQSHDEQLAHKVWQVSEETITKIIRR